MKRALFFVTMAAMLLASCSQDEVVMENTSSGSVIGFATHIDKTSRAVTDANINYLTQFNVWGAKTRNAGTSTSVTPIMENQLVKKESGLWTYSPQRYWIKDNAYFFNAFACYPANSSAYYTYTLPTTIGAGDFSKYYQGTLTYNNGASGANGNTDLIWANKHIVTISDTNPAPEAVRFTFGHLLCKVNLKFINEFTSNDEDLTIYDVAIENAATGVLDMNTIATGTPVSEMVWTPGTDKYAMPYRFGISGTDNVVSFKYGNSRSTEYKSLIPNQESITVSFKVKTKVMTDANEYLNITTTVKPSTIINNEIGFQSGYSYTLVAHLNQKTLGNLEPIKFDVVKVEDYVTFENPGTGEYLVDLTPTETNLRISKATNTEVHVNSIKAKELVYLGEFIPEDYSYEWSITSPDNATTSLTFPTTSRAATSVLTIAAGTYKKLSDMSITLKATPSTEKSTDPETYIVTLKIKDADGVVVGEDSMNVNISYPETTTGGSMDGNDNDG